LPVLSDRLAAKPTARVGRRITPIGVEHLSETPEKQGVGQQGGAESGALGGDSGFADAVAAVMRLPLSDGEKAQAVRRLLG